MSAATRRPYLGEDVHVSEENPETKDVECVPAVVRAFGEGGAVDLFVLRRPVPGYTWMKFDAGHRHGTFHWQH
jgi:hypothetical protein